MVSTNLGSLLAGASLTLGVGHRRGLLSGGLRGRRLSLRKNISKSCPPHADFLNSREHDAIWWLNQTASKLQPDHRRRTYPFSGLCNRRNMLRFLAAQDELSYDILQVGRSLC